MKLPTVKNALHVILILVAMSFCYESSAAGIQRIPKRWYVISLYGGTSMPQGSYKGLAGLPLEDESGNQLNVDASDLYDDGSHVGIEYGMMRERALFTQGFRYTDIQFKDPVTIPGYQPFRPFGAVNANMTQWDFDLTLHYFMTDLSAQPAAPYIGIGTQIGATSVTSPGYKSENKMTFGLSADFGADLKIATGANSRTMVALSSVNSYQFVGTNYRPKYLNVGVGLKYYFRP